MYTPYTCHDIVLSIFIYIIHYICYSLCIIHYMLFTYIIHFIYIIVTTTLRGYFILSFAEENSSKKVHLDEH